MAFETQEVNIKTKKILGVGEFAVNTQINLDTEKPLKKILSVNAIANIESVEKVDVDFTALGKTQINVVYLTENDVVECITGFADWQNSIKVVGESLQSWVNVCEVGTEVSNKASVSVSVLQNMFVEGIASQQLVVLKPDQEGCVADSQLIKTNQIVATNSGKFVIAENIEMPDAKQVLNVDVACKTKNVYCSIDQVTIEGSAEVKILYLTEEGFATTNKSIDFKQEVACTGALMDNFAHAQLKVASINATLETAEKANLVLAVGVNAFVDAYCVKEFEVLKDIYSLNKELSVVTECVNYKNYQSSKNYTDTIVCNINFEHKNIDEVLGFVHSNVAVAQYAINNNALVIEGLLKGALIYKDNQTNEISSLEISYPFVSKTDVDGGTLDCVSVNCFISNFKLRSAAELEVVADLYVGAIINSEEYFECINEVQELAEKQTSNSAITIYVTKEDESLFNVAKALNVLPEVITTQNEVVDGKFAGGQRIFVYSPLNVEF